MIELRRAILVAFVAAAAGTATAQTGAPQPQPGASQQQGTSDDAVARLIDDLVAANRILVDQGVLDGYGHVSVRSPRDPTHFYMARSVAPEMVTAKDILEYDLTGEPVEAPKGMALYAERFIHSEIYRARPDVMAVAHNHAPSLIPFGVTGLDLKPLYHMSAFLGGGVPNFDIRTAGGDTDMLVRNPTLGKALAKTLGSRPVALMRGHGAVVVATDLPRVVFRSVYTEQNAKLQAQAMQLGKQVKFLDAEEAKKAEASIGATIGRPWELWKRKALAGAAQK